MRGIGRSTLSSSDPHLLFLFRFTGGVSDSLKLSADGWLCCGEISGTGKAAGGLTAVLECPVKSAEF